MNIGAIGRNKARDVFNIISDMFYGEKDKVHNGLVPMDMVLEYFNIRYAIILSSLLLLAIMIIVLDYMRTRIGLKSSQYTKEDIEFEKV